MQQSFKTIIAVLLACFFCYFSKLHSTGNTHALNSCRVGKQGKGLKVTQHERNKRIPPRSNTESHLVNFVKPIVVDMTIMTKYSGALYWIKLMK